MEPFIVTFRFETAPILRGGCTLDAVLGGEIARRVQRREEAIRRTPLACTDQVHHGSSLILLGDTGVSRPVPAVQNPRRAFLAAAAATISTARSRVTPGSAKNILNRYEARVCEGGAWLGAGRIEDVHALLVPGHGDREAPPLRVGHDRTGLACDRARGRGPRDVGSRHRAGRSGFRERADRTETPPAARSLPAPRRRSAR